MLDYEAYENFILEFYNEKEKELKVSENNDEKLLFAILFELKNFQKETKIEEIIEVFEILNPNIIKRFEIKNVVESFESILTAVKFFIKARLKSINNNLNVLQPDNYKKILVFDLFEVTVENFLFDAAYSDLISKMMNYSIKYMTNIKSIKENKIVDKSLIANLDSFLSELIFGNKAINSIVNTFYNQKDLQLKFYLPRAWNIYFKRNKINNLKEFLAGKKSNINLIHILCICASIYNSENAIVIYEFVENIKDNNQEVLFYKFLFIFFALKKDSKKSIDIFRKSLQNINSDDNKFVVQLISQLYNINIEQEITKDIKNLCLHFNEYCDDYNEISLIFTNRNNVQNEKFTIFEAIRIMDSVDKLTFVDKSGTMKFLFDQIEKDPTFFIETFVKFEKIEDFEWIFLEKKCLENQFIGLAINLINRHKNLKNYKKIFYIVKNNPEFYKVKKLVNELTSDEKIKLAKDRNFCNLDFFKNLDQINLFSILKNQELTDNENYYKKNHYEILDEYVRLYKFNFTEFKNISKCDMDYCVFKRLEKDPKYIENFIENYSETDDQIPFDFSKLRQQEIINEIAINYLIKGNENMLDLLYKIFGNDFYYMPIVLKDFKNLKTLMSIDKFKNLM